MVGIWLFSSLWGCASRGPSAAPPPPVADAPTVSGDCRFDEPVADEPVEADGLRRVPPDHPHIVYVGRIDCSDPSGPRFSHPSVTVAVRFEGTSLDLELQDGGLGTVETTNYFDVVIDGGPATVLEVSPDRTRYVLARDLEPRVHTVVVAKRTESGPKVPNSGLTTFRGFRVAGDARLLPIERPSRRLEVVGDSLAAGYGIEAAVDGHAPYTSRNANGNLALGALAARELGAEYLAVVYSGRGMTANYEGAPGDTLPEMYDRVLPDEPDSPRWDFARWVPQVVVVGLGSNDVTAPEFDRQDFREAYVSFLGRIRGNYPHAVVLVESPTEDWRGPSPEVAARIREDLITIVETRRAAGDDDVHIVAFPHVEGPPFGEDFHLTTAGHEQLAEHLVARIRELTDW